MFTEFVLNKYKMKTVWEKQEIKYSTKKGQKFVNDYNIL